MIKTHKILSSSILGGADAFHVGFTLLRLAVKYKLARLQTEALEVLVEAWPTSLALWDRRMKLTPSTCGIETFGTALPHPMYATTSYRFFSSSDDL
jgi:hypothetical protein